MNFTIRKWILFSVLVSLSFGTIVSCKFLQSTATSSPQSVQLASSERDNKIASGGEPLYAKVWPTLLTTNFTPLNQSVEGGENPFANDTSKVILVLFWASWCDLCKAVVTQMNQYIDKYEGESFSVYAVSVDENVEQAKQSLSQFTSHSYKIIHSADPKILSQLKYKTIPVSFLFDEERTLKVQFLRKWKHRHIPKYLNQELKVDKSYVAK